MIISLGRPTNMTFQKKPPQTLVRLSEVEPFVSMHTEVMICKGLIEPRFDYCKAV